MIAVVGPTATGKTTLAAHLAVRINGAVISADSRQVYKGMDIGTGKDLGDFVVNGQKVPYYTTDIAEPGDKYNIFQFQKDFWEIFTKLQKEGTFPILCGGSGLYIEAVLKGYYLPDVPRNLKLRKELKDLSEEELVETLSSYRKLHNTTDTNSRTRLVRAIEIEAYKANHPPKQQNIPELNPLIIGIKFDRSVIRERITLRLKQRLEQGMIEEIKGLIASGVKPKDLIYYGLEYKYVTLYVLGKMTYDEMFTKLNTAIHQFAKRQETWFRKMERDGFKIHWIDGSLSLEEKVETVLSLCEGLGK